MEIIDEKEENTTISVNKDELRAFICALGESLEVVEDRKYETQMGVKVTEVRKLISEFNSVYRMTDETKLISVSDYEIRAIRRGLITSFMIDDWEYPIRMGFSKQEVMKVLAQFNAITNLSS